jgi:hypothetical protein
LSNWQDDDDRVGEDYGQNDGDAGPQRHAQFTPKGAGQPWLRSGMTPWHLWGNSQLIEATVQDSAASVRTNSPGQLVKISYKRPETWHWLLAAKLISGPASTTVSTQIQVAFDLTVGVGRSVVLMQSAGAFQDKSFESFFFQWGPVSTLFPRNVQLYSTQVLAPNRMYRSEAPLPNQDGFPVAGAFVTGPPTIEQIVAEDIQLSCRVIALAATGSATIGEKVVVEVSAQFAPVVHVRPDWYRSGPEEVAFPGAETEGR